MGFISLERGGPPEEWPVLRDSWMDPARYPFPFIIETVQGAWTDVVVPGDPKLESACVAAAQRLVDRGAAAVLGNCGFFIRHQDAVAAAVKVPVATSTLLMVPALLRQMPVGRKLAVLTADSKQLTRELLGVDGEGQSRIVIGGIEGGKYMADAVKRPLPPPDGDALRDDVSRCVKRVLEAHPDVAAFLCECTAFPAATPAMRRMTGLPFYDIINLAHITMASIH